MKCYN